MNKPWITVHRSAKHIYAQILQAENQQVKVLATASTLDKVLRDSLAGNKTDNAHQVGRLIGKRAIELGIKQLAFDRSGFKYHGRVKALAEGARESGVEF